MSNHPSERKTADQKMKNKGNNYELWALTVGEIAVAALVVSVYYILSLFGIVGFGIKVPLGATLGAAVTVFNLFFLILSVNRAVDRYIALRGSREMTDEEAEKFANENSMAIQNAIKSSFIVRTLTMVAALVVAFLTGVFDPIATVIPLLMYRPILSVSALIKAKLYPEAETEYVPTTETTETKEDNE